MMKRVLKLWSVMVLMIGVYMLLPMEARADGETYNITYDYTSGEWCSFYNGYWLRGVSAVEGAVKDGDSVLINGDNREGAPMVTVNLNARMEVVAVTGGGMASVTAKGVDTAYATGVDGSTLILFSDVTTLLALQGATNQIMGNVSEVQASYQEGMQTKIGVSGTIGKMNVYIHPDSWNQKTIYNVAEGKIKISEDNYLDTDPQYYSLTPTEDNTSETQSQKEAASSNVTKQLDKVPKTGNNMKVSGTFFILAGVFAAGGIMSKRFDFKE